VRIWLVAESLDTGGGAAPPRICRTLDRAHQLRALGKPRASEPLDSAQVAGLEPSELSSRSTSVSVAWEGLTCGSRWRISAHLWNVLTAPRPITRLGLQTHERSVSDLVKGLVEDPVAGWFAPAARSNQAR
jgi:hypothetical protein